jgi:two-component system, OmpR family, response regulator TrcR
MSPHTKRKEKRILLIEDEPTYRTSILSVLRKADFHCSFCIDGDHAQKKLEQEKFDLMIVDFLIPGPNGIEVVDWARKHKISIPALIITNYPSDELTASCKPLGHTKVVAKQSINMAGMLEIVQEMLT